MKSRRGGGSDPSATHFPRRLRRAGRSHPSPTHTKCVSKHALSAFRVLSSFGTSMNQNEYQIESKPIPV